MRRMLAFLLLASAAAPSFAAPDDSGDGDSGRPKAERSERSERADGPRQRHQGERPARQATADRPVRSADSPPDNGSPSAERGRNGGNPQQDVGRPAGAERDSPTERQRGAGDSVRSLRHRDSSDTVRNWRTNERRLAGSPAAIEERNLPQEIPTTESGQSIEDRNVRRLGRTARNGPLVREVPTTGGPTDRRVRRIGNVQPVPGVQAPEPATAGSRAARTAHGWRSDWRRDRRYDWRDWRRRHRSRFHLGFYFDPFGWNYQRFGIGWRLWPSFYSNRYWLNDPWHYRLPPAYGPYRWIRYHNDALLVNIYTGQVVDVVYNFFW